ncbi:MAG TPA: ABC transporter permease, partial [Thermoanaerobaculia bacterium]
MHDLRFTLRNLARSPGFAAAAILTLAVAIGANTAMFSILYAVVLQPLPFRESERLVRVWETDRHNDSEREAASAPDFEDWKSQQRVFANVAGTTNRMLNLTERNEEAERISASAVSHDYFAMLGVAPIAGRAFVAADDKQGAAPVAILSDALWQRRFGRRDVIGKRITLDGVTHEVVGVMPRGASLSREPSEVWTPLALALAQFRDARGVHNVYVIGRLKDGVGVTRAQSEMTVIAERLATQYPNDNVGRGAFVEPLIDSMVRDARPRLFLLGGAVLA